MKNKTRVEEAQEILCSFLTHSGWGTKKYESHELPMVYFKAGYNIVLQEGSMKAAVKLEDTILFWFKVEQYFINPTYSFLKHTDTSADETISQTKTMINPVNIIF